MPRRGREVVDVEHDHEEGPRKKPPPPKSNASFQYNAKALVEYAPWKNGRGMELPFLMAHGEQLLVEMKWYHDESDDSYSWVATSPYFEERHDLLENYLCATKMQEFLDTVSRRVKLLGPCIRCSTLWDNEFNNKEFICGRCIVLDICKIPKKDRRCYGCFSVDSDFVWQCRYCVHSVRCHQCALEDEAVRGPETAHACPTCRAPLQRIIP